MFVADVEYISGPLHSRIRDPEVGWRLGPTQSLHAGLCRGAEAQD